MNDAASASGSLLDRVREEADLCRNEGADDIANLLEEVDRALSRATPTAFEYAAKRAMAVTSEWCRGWDDCRAYSEPSADAAVQDVS